jgi:hypothetical protein
MQDATHMPPMPNTSQRSLCSPLTRAAASLAAAMQPPPRVGLSLRGPLPPPPHRPAGERRARTAARGACFAAAAGAAVAFSCALPLPATAAAPVVVTAPK